MGCHATPFVPAIRIRVPRSKLLSTFVFDAQASVPSPDLVSPLAPQPVEQGHSRAAQSSLPESPRSPNSMQNQSDPNESGLQFVDNGTLAIYRLKAGEAIYSSVVLRFTQSVHAEEVSRLVQRLISLNAITDPTDIAIGFPVKIPIEMLSPEYLPASNPRRELYERSRREARRYRDVAKAPDLEGVYVILDPGHGGKDLGAFTEAVWEHDYVYDVMCRIKRLLESTTGASVDSPHPR